MTENNQTKDPAVMLPFTPIDEHLMRSRTIFMSGVVNAELALKINRELMALERMDENLAITIWINSPGGEVQSGFAVYDTIQFIKPKVITIISGTAASMGSIIALAAEKENRYITTNSKILIHQPLISGTFGGPASDIEIHAKEIIALKHRIFELYAERTGTPAETYKELMERDRWVYLDEAISLGLVSKVIHSKDDIT